MTEKSGEQKNVDARIRGHDEETKTTTLYPVMVGEGRPSTSFSFVPLKNSWMLGPSPSMTKKSYRCPVLPAMRNNVPIYQPSATCAKSRPRRAVGLGRRAAFSLRL